MCVQACKQCLRVPTALLGAQRAADNCRPMSAMNCCHADESELMSCDFSA